MDDSVDLGGGQTRMEVAFGAGDGDEEASAVVTKSETKLGSIFLNKMCAVITKFEFIFLKGEKSTSSSFF